MSTLSQIFLLAISVVFVSADPQCPGLLAVEEDPITYDEQLEIEVTHNILREAFAKGIRTPKASDMQRMFYTKELADQAQGIAASCISNSIPNLKDNKGRLLGQLYYNKWTTKDQGRKNWSEPMAKWTEEQDYYQYPNTNSNTKKPIKNFIALITAPTNQLGCGYLRYTNTKIVDGKNRTVFNENYVCLYAPSGTSTAPYQVGPGCDNLCDAGVTS